jgi:hypothetical protein
LIANSQGTLQSELTKVRELRRAAVKPFENATESMASRCKEVLQSKILVDDRFQVKPEEMMGILQEMDIEPLSSTWPTWV